MILNIKALITTFILGFGLSSLSCGQADKTIVNKKAAITDAVEQAMDSAQTVAGLQVAVVKGDEIIYSKGFGTRNIDTNEPVTSNTGMYIASTTKSFVGQLGAILAEENRIDLDAPITSYFPNLAFDSTKIQADRISLRDHLAQRTGYENNQLAYLPPTIGNLSTDRMVHLVGKYSMPKPITFNYRNESYIMAAEVMGKATGQHWKQMLEEKIFSPLGMDRTTAFISEARDKEFAFPHDVLNRKVQRREAKADTNMHAAGGLVSTANDLSTWLITVMNEGQLDGEQKLSKRAVNEASSLQIRLDATFYSRIKRYGYGFGLYHADYEGDRLMHHFGGFTGYHCHMSYMPEHDIGVVVLANSGTIIPHDIALHIYDIMLDKAKPQRYAGWLAEYKEWFDGVIESNAKDRKKWLKGIDKGNPTLSLSEYTGNFENPKLGIIKITKEDGQLFAKFGPKASEVKHFKEDTFLVSWSSRDPGIDLSSETPYKLVFKTDIEGKISSFKMESSGFGDLGTFTRVEPK